MPLVRRERVSRLALALAAAPLVAFGAGAMHCPETYQLRLRLSLLISDYRGCLCDDCAQHYGLPTRPSVFNCCCRRPRSAGPHSFMAALGAGSAAIAAAAIWKRQPAANGRCPRCGYDL